MLSDQALIERDPLGQEDWTGEGDDLGYGFQDVGAAGSSCQSAPPEVA